MFLSRNKKNNIYPYKPVFKGVKLYRYVFVMSLALTLSLNIIHRVIFIAVPLFSFSSYMFSLLRFVILACHVYVTIEVTTVYVLQFFVCSHMVLYAAFVLSL